MASDSTQPLIFKRNKTKPTVRTRQTSPENDTDANASATAEDSPSTLATKLKNKVKRMKPKSRLSFGADEEV
jgi:GC-rich sequence DNA-binding factor